MLDFSGVKNRTTTFADLTKGLTKADLRRLTDEMIDTQLSIISDATDAGVVMIPVDANANDTYGKAEDKDLAWTLGHVVVHVTASSEESAAISSVLARGLKMDDRSRYETPWETVTTVAQLRQRLEESRRMRHAFLETWPDQPDLEMAQQLSFGTFNAVSRFVVGLYHDTDHLEQMREIMRQTHAAGH
jgi:DinB family protein